MHSEDSVTLPEGIKPRAFFIPALICAAISVAVMRSNFLSFFFLVPLGYAAAAYNSAVAWLACVSAVVMHSSLSLGMVTYYQGNSGETGIHILYYTVLSFGFTWIMAGGRGGRIRTLYRFVIVAIAGALAFFVLAFSSRETPFFSALLSSQSEVLSSLFVSASEADAARRSFLEHLLTPERISALITSIALRGGALVSAFFLFFISRQIGLSGAWFFKKRRSQRSLLSFHVPAFAVWGLSCSLAGVLFGRLINAVVFEIAAWNLLTLNAILFLAQGIGIVQFALVRRPLPFGIRFILDALIIMAILSPGVNVLVLGGLILLGIAENWLPLRVVKTDRPASTPGL